MTSQHCTLDDLLAIRDGEGSLTARKHLDGCDRCQAELDRLHQRVAALKALPALRPPRDRWPQVRAMVTGARRRRRRIMAGWASLAAAAAVVVMVGVHAVGMHRQVAARMANLDSLVAQSQQLEEALRAYDPTSRVLSGRAASTIAQIEDRIAMVDAQLAEAQRGGARQAQLVPLWQQRVQLMGQLVKVHVTRAAYVGL
jgi:anti-sigma factor RsiW